MGGIGHAIGKVFGGVAKIFGGGRSSGSVTVSTPAPAAPTQDATNNQTAIESDSKKRKKKSAGKKSLMIGAGGDSSGGGTTGTGLNL